MEYQRNLLLITLSSLVVMCLLFNLLVHDFPTYSITADISHSRLQSNLISDGYDQMIMTSHEDGEYTNLTHNIPENKLYSLSITARNRLIELSRIEEEEKEGRRLRRKRKRREIKERKRQAGNDTVKTILFWTTQLGNDVWWELTELGREPLFNYQCPEDRCTVSRDRSLVDRADMLVFFYKDPPDWPKVRHSNQLYVHSIFEPPGPHYSFLSKYDGLINLTMNYRHDADIPMPYQKYVEHPPELMRQGKYFIRNPLSVRNRSVVWPVSNCGAASKRDEYVKELSEYIDVDIFGRCGNLSCENTKLKPCHLAWEKQYRFFLSFENAYCEDYVTEKLFSPLKFELIPIVFGMPDYQKIAPPHSVIDVRDFKSPKDLAAYLHYLADNPVKYTEYFQWKQKWGIDGVSKQICALCDVLHKTSFRYRPAHQHYSAWFLNETVCHNNILKLKLN